MRGKGTDDRRLVLLYIYLAASCTFLGTSLVFATLFFCSYLSIDITKNYWVLVIPIVLTLLLNIVLIELVQRIRNR
jgi:hypothetical protein